MLIKHIAFKTVIQLLLQTKTPFTEQSVNGVHYLDIDTDIHILPFRKFEMVNH